MSLLFFAFLIAVAGKAGNCVLTAKECLNFPVYKNTQFRDKTRFESTPEPCLRRAEEFHNWCGNEKETTVAATYEPTMTTQIYRPMLCDPGWSQYGANCYIHHWDKRTWWEADAICRSTGAHLASVHSEGENRFIFSLTRGVSAWIGFTDIRKEEDPEDWSWTDTSENDFVNWNKNCTDREHEPGCAPEEKAQQWYEWEGGDKGTYVCKKEAKRPIDLIYDWAFDEIAESTWSFLMTTPSVVTPPAFNESICIEPMVNYTESILAKNATKKGGYDSGYGQEYGEDRKILTDALRPRYMDSPVEAKGLMSSWWKSLR